MSDSLPEPIRDRVAPHLLQDVDGLWAEWLDEAGNADGDAFVAHLITWNLVPAELRPDAAAPEVAQRKRFRKVGDELRETGGLPGLDAVAAARTLSALDRYEVVGVIGEGAMGRVELVRDRQLARRVAFKRMNPGLHAQPVLARRFAIEARITAQLDHPGIVPIYNLEGADAYTMKWVEGRTLRGLVEEGAELSHLVEHFVRVCDTLAYAHARGVVHRDIKPENLMVGRFGETWVMDWGIARVTRTDVESPVDVAQDDVPVENEGDLVIGTPGYMSPEQAGGKNAKVGPASDQYALGLVLFELIARRPAVSGRNAMALVTRQQEGEHDALPRSSDPDLTAIVARTLQKKAKDRYPSVSALAEDLRRWQRGQVVSVRPEGLLRRVLRVVGRRADVLVGLVVAVLVLAFVGTVTTVGLVTWRAQRNAAYEQADRAMATLASAHARALEGQMLKFEGLVNVLATVADAGHGDVAPVTWSSAFASADTAPADAVLHGEGDKYGPGRVSAYTPVFVVGHGADPEALRPLAEGLAGAVGRQFPRVLLRSHDERRATVGESMGRRTLLGVEIPARRAWTWLPEGLFVALPGQEWAADPSVSVPVVAGRTADAPLWVPTWTDASGREVVSVVLAVPRGDGQPAVAGVDLSTRWFAQNLLPEAWRRDGVRAFVLDGSGRVVVANDGTPTGEVPLPALSAALSERRSGDLGDGATPVLAYPLTTSGWSLVITGERSMLTE